MASPVAGTSHDTGTPGVSGGAGGVAPAAAGTGGAPLVEPGSAGSSGSGGTATPGTAGTGGALEPTLEWPAGIIDTHTHFWDLTRNPGFSNGKTELPSTYAELARPAGVTGTVLVEAVWQTLDDNLWGLQLADQNPIVVAVIGQLSVGSASFAADLEQLAQNPRFRGLRVGAADLTSDQVQLLAARGLVADVNLAGSSESLTLVAQKAPQVPQLKIVIEHAAGLTFSGAPTGALADGLKLAAASPNVFCKLSRFQEQSGARPAPTDAAAYAPTLDFLFATFGEDRLLFGSNWPLSEEAGSLSAAVEVMEAYLQGKDPGVAHKFFSANAAAIYGE